MKTLNILVSCGSSQYELLKKELEHSSVGEKFKTNIFFGRPWFLDVDGEIGPNYKKEKMDYLIIGAEDIFNHSLNLREIKEKLGEEKVEIIIFSCCNDCDSIVEKQYGDIISGFCSKGCFGFTEYIQEHFIPKILS